MLEEVGGTVGESQFKSNLGDLRVKKLEKAEVNCKHLVHGALSPQ